MKIPAVIFLLLLGSALGAQTLPGYVTLQNSGNRSAAPTSVSAAGATSDTVRDTDGFFQLFFDDKLPGQDVEIRVEKPNYEVVNHEALFARLPDTAAGAPPLRIYLCPQGQWRRFADQYYETNQRELRDRFEQRIRSAQQRLYVADSANRALADTIARLSAERDAALDLLEGYAEQLARTNLDDVTERYRLGFRLFAEGRLDSFFMLIREKDIRADLAQAASEIQRARALGRTGSAKMAAGLELRQRTLRELLIRARALAVSGQWDDADRTFGIAVQEDSTNRDALGEYFRFKRNRTQYSEARLLAERLLALPAGSAADSAFWWNEIGRSCALLRDYEQALVCYRRSEALYKPLTRRNATLLPKYAEMLGNMANTCRIMGDYASVRRLHEESLSILERAARILKIAGPMLPAQMIHIGDAYTQVQDFARAEATYLRAAELMGKSADTLSREYKEWMVHQRMALVNTYLNTKRPNQAIVLLRELWVQSADDARRDPGRYLWEYITITTFLGNTFMAQENMGEAERFLGMADSIIGQIPRPLSPYLEEIERQLVNSLGQVGFFLANRTDHFWGEQPTEHPDTLLLAFAEQSRALRYIDKAAGHFPELDDLTSAALLPRLNLAVISLALNDSTQAQLFLSQCRPLFENAHTAPDVFKIRLARVANAFGSYFQKNQNPEKARTHLKGAAEIFESIGQPSDTTRTQAVFNALQIVEIDLSLYRKTRFKVLLEEARDYLKVAEQVARKLTKSYERQAEVWKAIDTTGMALKKSR